MKRKLYITFHCCFLLMPCTTSTSTKKMWHDHTVILVILDQDLAFSNVKNFEKQA